jgi:hypothetical protein
MRTLSPRLAALLMVLTFASGAAAATSSLSEYRRELQAILTALDANKLDDAQRAARRLNGVTINAGGVVFKADASILQPIENASTIADVEPQKRRVKALLVATADANTGDISRAAPDHQLLDKLRKEEDVVLPPKDGQIEDGGVLNSSIFKTIAGWLGDALQWIFKQLGKLLDWLAKMLPSRTPGGGMGNGVTYVLVAAAVAVALLVLRAYWKSRKFKSAPHTESSGAPAPSKDADPLSRDSDEWQEYALHLASIGRYREAIRAWYHAALVLLFRSGNLNYRKGRTNWEYCYSLSQDIPWRRRFLELTGAFEVEWYGRETSTPDVAGSYGDAAREFLSKAHAGRNA